MDAQFKQRLLSSISGQKITHFDTHDDEAVIVFSNKAAMRFTNKDEGLAGKGTMALGSTKAEDTTIADVDDDTRNITSSDPKSPDLVSMFTFYNKQHEAVAVMSFKREGTDADFINPPQQVAIEIGTLQQAP